MIIDENSRDLLETIEHFCETVITQPEAHPGGMPTRDSMIVMLAGGIGTLASNDDKRAQRMVARLAVIANCPDSESWELIMKAITHAYEGNQEKYANRS